MRKAISGIIFTLLILACTLTLILNIQTIKAESRTWIVDDDGPADFHEIQAAINAAKSGDTIYVKGGTYYEHIFVNKSLELKGEDKSTIIDGSGTGRVVYVTADYVTISGFSIRNSGYDVYDGGIWLSSDNNKVSNNDIKDNSWGIVVDHATANIISDNIIHGLEHSYGSWGGGIFLWSSSNNRIFNNTISCHEDNAIFLEEGSNNNYIIGNTLLNQLFSGIHVGASNNFIYHNNFLEETYQVWISTGTLNVWDNCYPSGGNYWSDYTGVDQYSGPNQDQPGSDGIGDTPYIIDEYNRDRYPLMKPYAPPSVLLPPVASFSYNPSNPKVNEKVSFDASASYDPDGQIVSYKWSFGDGSIDEGKTVTHAYSTEGNYKVTLMVIDNDGKSCSTSKTVTVVKPTPTANRLKILDKYFDILNQSTGWTQSGSFYYLNYEPDGKRLPRSSKTVSGYTTVDDGDVYPSQCVDFVRVLSNTIYIKTKDWRQGPNVMTATDIEPGTVVATFKGGKYPADGTGHVAVFAGFTYSDGRKTGFKVFDQNWRTDGGLGVVGKHFIYTIGSGVADADNYYIVTLEGISIKATCPVDLEVIDPDSLKIRKEFSEIPEAIYIEEDLNDDGYPDDYIFIPERKIGEYLIRVIPEPDADPNTNYTLEVSSADMTLILAENVPLHDIPTEPYIIASATFETPPPPSVITATIDVDPDNLNLGSKGKWVTAYIELPEGYDIADINVSSILLNGGIPVDVNAPIAIGDYDNDSIPDLLVKFNRDEVATYILDCIDTAELYINRFMTATLKITGKLNDETRFQGNYTIRIIMPMQKSSKLVQFL
jgi:parallel beta-helix repeat protein